MGGGAPLSVFRAFCVGFDAALTCCSLDISWCPGKTTEQESMLPDIDAFFGPDSMDSHQGIN